MKQCWVLLTFDSGSCCPKIFFQTFSVESSCERVGAGHVIDVIVKLRRAARQFQTLFGTLRQPPGNAAVNQCKNVTIPQRLVE